MADKRRLNWQSVWAALLLSACAVPSPPPREDLVKEAMPNVAVPASWQAAQFGGSVVQADWWHGFGDQQLDALIDEALANTPDVRIAAARVERASAYATAAGAALMPVVSGLARGGGKMSGDNSGLTGWAVHVSWEADLWGRVRAQREAAKEQVAAAEADRIWARQSIAAAVARAWFVAIQARLVDSLLRRSLEANERLVALANDRQRVGKGDGLDVVQAEANVLATRDALRQAALAIDQSRRALESLLGRYPAAALQTAERFPDVALEVPTGVPSELLERRPDVIAAERRVSAAFDNVTVAKAARLPRLSLTAGINSVHSELFVLQNHENPTFSAGASLFGTIFDFGALAAQVDVRSAERKEAVARYAQTALNAFSEVEGALANNVALAERHDLLAQQAQRQQEALRLAQERLRVGSGDQRAVLQQQLALYLVLQQQLTVDAQQRIERVNLLLALGGGLET
jgi:NodT family efflux transporter outer membrane factor (OMF) lipoprotein